MSPTRGPTFLLRRVVSAHELVQNRNWLALNIEVPPPPTWIADSLPPSLMICFLKQGMKLGRVKFARFVPNTLSAYIRVLKTILACPQIADL